ncbi:hypothetical protein [Gluconobacter wancherniae]|uniref:Lipoprotein n=1 Tax=Gluconobacter wancherniae NBRC 103581 TaxID=656744 RepID=A0A511AYC8_9PROT|nr:hypothetical protein [Gluconobacter wancherniae]MBF0853379.1 hypothetical protein [Gluconobacter wancherniae]MBS1063388.1 hypothetical protein [Gluconobacter wancherniae]MBS1088193.1 hypothetical protein [Gluconobacter wancherniae]MBS1093879.1 hypothetical protein [Gluconobacter wancherniae]GBD55888.1 hypothetical protein NBRC103581_00459 [Gluconobacter wancherniae NBRC 103581]
MRPFFLRAVAAISASAALSGCGYFESRSAHRAQFEMVGMTGYDLQACAGTPGSTKKLNDTTEIWQYDGSMPLPAVPDSTLIPVQSFVSIYQSAIGGGGTACRMIVRMDHDRVSEVHYSGNDDEYVGEDGICSIITRGCARQREATMHSAGGIFGPVSAFHPPATPAQSTSATYSTQSGQYVPDFSGDPKKSVIQPAGK